MATVYDTWHKTYPRPTDKPCREHKGKYPTADHGKGKRWQVRYRDPQGAQKKEDFELKTKADSRVAELKAALDDGTYIDPAATRITLGAYAEKWFRNNTAGPTTEVRYEGVVRNHIVGRLGHHEMRVFNDPEPVRAWIRELLEVPLAASTIGGIGDVLSSIFDAAVDSGILRRNPCKASSVSWPKVPPKPVVPWTRERVLAVLEGLPESFRAGGAVGVGCGLRQGEIFALTEDDIDFEGGWLHVNQQIRFVGSKMVFALPKGDKIRSVPLSPATAKALRAHLAAFGPTSATLPWHKPDGKPKTRELLFVDAKGKPHNRSVFNQGLWKRALVHAGVIPPRTSGSQYFEAAPDDGMHALRHTYASAQLEGGTSIKALAVYLGHSDPGFTLRTYTHLMPSSEGRARSATDDFLLGAAEQERRQGTSGPVCPGCALAA
ncbi:tyrosine-type recombinase/integrase [Kitasatospora purpeofusca]|uniref:tyrosine-type recombinase/integrase n=1 Tax=Kitasatospora purpeofusca TaxID=67352 RepID=UPI00224E397E|nr:site-specific integrase [Kitasatospora purpeofusca]MCX4753463.1 site-specific integrase [Kitasatospora purpeofusca]WSR32959.1 site-specific integrase [Kitasatospora purpeofusca]